MNTESPDLLRIEALEDELGRLRAALGDIFRTTEMPADSFLGEYEEAAVKAHRIARIALKASNDRIPPK